MTDEEVIRRLIQAVARLEERDAAMERRVNLFQSEMERIGDSLKATTATLNAIRNVLIVVVLQLIAAGVLESEALVGVIKGVLGG